LFRKVQNKAELLPRAEPDSEVFGQYDQKNERLRALKEKEVSAAKYNRYIVEQRKREEMLAEIREQETDQENVERVKEEFRIDRVNRAKRLLELRKSVEKDWQFADADKKERDLDERFHRMAVDGGLVHEQCDKYKRCAQCERALKNCGESNIWADTRYVAGTRLMT
jgi:PAB1-binding protein PBP1